MQPYFCFISSHVGEEQMKEEELEAKDKSHTHAYMMSTK